MRGNGAVCAVCTRPMARPDGSSDFVVVIDADKSLRRAYSLKVQVFCPEISCSAAQYIVEILHL